MDKEHRGFIFYIRTHDAKESGLLAKAVTEEKMSKIKRT